MAEHLRLDPFGQMLTIQLADGLPRTVEGQKRRILRFLCQPYRQVFAAAGGAPGVALQLKLQDVGRRGIGILDEGLTRVEIDEDGRRYQDQAQSQGDEGGSVRDLRPTWG